MKISRRDFLKGVGAGIAGAALTGVPVASLASEEGTSSAPQGSANGFPASQVQNKGVLLGDILNPQDDSFTTYTTDYSHIFSPLKIGGVTLRNRIVKSSAGSEMQKRPDWPDDTTLEYYRRFARGGVAMICTEASNCIASPLPSFLAGMAPGTSDMPEGMPGMADSAAGLPEAKGTFVEAYADFVELCITH